MVSKRVQVTLPTPARTAAGMVPNVAGVVVLDVHVAAVPPCYRKRLTPRTPLGWLASTTMFIGCHWLREPRPPAFTWESMRLGGKTD